MSKIRLVLAGLLTILTLTQSQPSQAAIGKLMHSKRVATVGLAISGAGVAVGVGGTALVNATCVDMGCLGVLVPIFVGGIMIGVGLVTLDGEQDIQFRSLTKKDALKLNVSEAESQIYNSEIDQANQLFSEVAESVSATDNMSPAQSAKIWDELKDLVSPATFLTMQKIVSQQ